MENKPGRAIIFVWSCIFQMYAFAVQCSSAGRLFLFRNRKRLRLYAVYFQLAFEGRLQDLREIDIMGNSQVVHPLGDSECLFDGCEQVRRLWKARLEQQRTSPMVMVVVFCYVLLRGHY